MGFPKRLLGEGETLVLELRPHAKRLIWPALLLILVAPVATFAAGLVPDGGLQAWVRGAIALAAGLVVLRWSVWPFLVWWNTVYVVTDRRLVMRTGVLNRRGHDMPLARLNDVSFSHNLLDRMLGCGDLVVESAGESGQVVLDDIPRVEQVQRTLYRLSDASRGIGPGDDEAGGGRGGRGGSEGGGGRPAPWPSARPFLDAHNAHDADARDDSDDHDSGGDPATDDDAGPDGDGERRRPWWGRRR